ncbi:ketoacyl-ACP synthase III [Paenibacillus tarimensis]
MPAQAFHSKSSITAFGTYVPERRLTNSDLERMVETSNEWILQRTGISERRIAEPDQFCSDLCIGAVRDLLANYPVTVDDVDYILVATSTPDTSFPSVASRVQAKFGIRNAGTADVQAACAGFVTGLQMANGLILTGAFRKILVIGADTLSKITDYTDRTTCILFGDGAGAALVEAAEEPSFIGAYTDTDGQYGHHLYRSALSAKIGEADIAATGTIVQNGREVYKWAVSRVSEGVRHILSRYEIAVNDIDWFIPHSANLRIIESINERTGIPMGRTLYSMVEYGNTSAATIPLALHKGIKEGRIKRGDLLLLYGFGGGLTQSALLVRWMLDSPA